MICEVGQQCSLHRSLHHCLFNLVMIESYINKHNNLKAVDTFGNCRKSVFSLGVSQHMHKITNLWKFELDWSSELRDNYERKKTPLSHKVVCFQMLDFETSNSKLEVSKSNSWKITPFSKTTSLQKERFLTMFYTVNLSPLLITK